jgi:glycosyltransferase involved in cell wall biosynthesis
MKSRKGFVCWDRGFHNPITKNYKISICTTVMNRIDNLKYTLPKNIEANSDYNNVEFIILDYNSSDGLGDWIKKEMFNHIKSGKLVYYRTEEPKFFDMSHSRNIAFKVASGDIVNNIDADALSLVTKGEGLASFINRMANQQPKNAIFAKSRQLLRGRIGFYKDEFIDILGGYDENLKGYGHDDANLLHRAWGLGFKLMAYRGGFCGIIPNHIKHQEGNYKKLWWETEGDNRLISYTNLITKRFKANEGREWGKAKLTKNFKEEIWGL